MSEPACKATARAMSTVLGITATASTDEHGNPVIRVSPADEKRLRDSAPLDSETLVALFKEILANKRGGEAPPS